MSLALILLLALLPALFFSLWVSWAAYRMCEMWDWPEGESRQQSRLTRWMQRMAIG